MGDMNGKTVVITGASSGIGEQIARNLLDAGARLVVGARSMARAEAARERLDVDAASFEVLELDLASQSSVRKFAADVLDRCPMIDVLVNNAGVQLPRREVTDEGIERVLATNVIGPHLLTQLLVPRLRDSAPARIVNMASSFAGEVDADDLQFERRPFNAARPYKQSKALNRLLTWELARRLEGSGVTANAVSPGLARTGLYRGLGRPMRLFMGALQRAFGVTVEQAADTATWLATSTDPEVAAMNGRFVEKRAVIDCKFADPALEADLWRRCEALLVEPATAHATAS